MPELQSWWTEPCSPQGPCCSVKSDEYILEKPEGKEVDPLTFKHLLTSLPHRCMIVFFSTSTPVFLLSQLSDLKLCCLLSCPRCMIVVSYNWVWVHLTTELYHWLFHACCCNGPLLEAGCCFMHVAVIEPALRLPVCFVWCLSMLIHLTDCPEQLLVAICEGVLFSWALTWSLFTVSSSNLWDHHDQPSQIMTNLI